MTDYGTRLRAAREHAGLAQAALGERVGVSGTAGSHWELGRSRPRGDAQEAVEEVLGVAPPSRPAVGPGPEASRETASEYADAYWLHPRLRRVWLHPTGGSSRRRNPCGE